MGIDLQPRNISIRINCLFDIGSEEKEFKEEVGLIQGIRAHTPGEMSKEISHLCDMMTEMQQSESQEQDEP